mgnify:CR=1 FL=1
MVDKDGHIISDHADITTAMNRHFLTIGLTLASKINSRPGVTNTKEYKETEIIILRETNI